MPRSAEFENLNHEIRQQTPFDRLQDTCDVGFAETPWWRTKTFVKKKRKTWFFALFTTHGIRSPHDNNLSNDNLGYTIMRMSVGYVHYSFIAERTTSFFSLSVP